MRYFFRLLLYCALFFLTFSISSVLLLRFIPVSVTPLKVIRLVENLGEKGIKVDSRWSGFNKINPTVMQAVASTEDNHFLTHWGFDFAAIDKAIDLNRRGKRKLGASTISQQTAKNVFCLPARTWVRKGVEAYYTLLIECMWGKRRIMEVYLNIIETGVNRFGVESVARNVYGKRAGELNRHEASMIATVLPNPIRMRLERPSDYMTRRAAQVRGLMNMIGPLDFDNPTPPNTPKKKKKR